MSLVRAFLIAVGMVLIVVALICMGADMMASLEAHGILSAASVADITALVDPGFWDSICPAHSPMCGMAIDHLMHLYTWVIPGIAGVILIWVGTLGRK